MRGATVLLQRHGRSRLLAATSLQGGGSSSSVPAVVNFHSDASRSSLSSKPLHATSLPALTSANINAFAVNPYSVQSRFKSTTTTTAAGVAPAVPPSVVVDRDEEDHKETEISAASSSETPTKKKGEPFLFNLGLPGLVPEWGKMFKMETLFSDVSAGLTVGCVAVPLSLAIAVASGVPAEVGLVTAAVSGVAGGLMGGTTLAITGPAAAISLLVVGAVEQHGLEALPVITLICGGMQLASGVTRLGVAAKLVPISVIAGFTTGVGTLILTGQIPKALGLSAPAGLSPFEIMSFLGENISMINPSSAALAIGTSAAMFGLPKIHPKIPSALIAVGGATLATHAFGLDVQLIGSLPSGLAAFQMAIPTMPPMDSFPSLLATSGLIYAMTSAESLLSCAALEKMKKTDYKHSPDQELIGQGLANMGAAMFMGMPVTSVIARSGLNVRLNAETRLPSLVQSAFVFSSVVFFSDSISSIPMPALSGMLITTGLGMLNPTEFKHCYAVTKMDTIPFLATIGGMVSFGLAEGIGIGCVSAVMIHYQHNMPKMVVQERPDMPLMDGHLHMHLTGSVWKVDGPVNFISMFEIDEMIRNIQEQRQCEHITDEHPIVLDVHEVSGVEFTGVEELVNRLVETGVPIRIVNCQEDMLHALEQCDPSQHITRTAAAGGVETNEETTTTTKTEEK
jgi:MFS superfamily sulfate permease-like transporter